MMKEKRTGLRFWIKIQLLNNCDKSEKYYSWIKYTITKYKQSTYSWNTMKFHLNIRYYSNERNKKKVILKKNLVMIG